MHHEQHLATISYKELFEFLEKLHSTDKVSFVIKKFSYVAIIDNGYTKRSCLL